MENSNIQTDQQLSKRERREQEQQDRLKREKREQRTQTLKRIGLWGGAVLALVLMVVGLAKLGAGDGPSASGGPLADPVTDTDWIKGNKDATVTLVEYSDFQCPACRAAQPAVQEILRQHGSNMRFVYRHYPLVQIHPNAHQAARAAEAAGKQGAFWEYHDKLFETQSSWAAEKNPRDTFVLFAEQLGLDKNKFLVDLDSAEVSNKVGADQTGGDRSNVNATPTFFLNGEKVTMQNFSDLVTLVGEAITKVNK